MPITSDVQAFDLGAIVDFFTLDLTGIGAPDVLHFHSGVNGLGNDVVWQGVTYSRYPVEAGGFELSGKGVLPRPKIAVANLDGTVGLMCFLYDDMLGAKITRKRTLMKYLDAVNFPGGINASANPGQHFADEVWYINRKMEHSSEGAITFELTAAWDVTGVKLPRQQMIQNSCPWKYRGAECGYTGTLYFDTFDQPAGTLLQDRCGKRLQSCKLRFGTTAELPIGSFPIMVQI